MSSGLPVRWAEMQVAAAGRVYLAERASAIAFSGGSGGTYPALRAWLGRAIRGLRPLAEEKRRLAQARCS